MDRAQLSAFVDDIWQRSILEYLQSYIRIPCKSPQFDPQWQSHGFIDAAMTLAADWCRAHAPSGTHIEIRQLPGRTPLLRVDVPGELQGCVVLYGHLDKQPEFSGWAPGLHPWEPVIRDGKLYGRGGADDGYAGAVRSPVTH